MRPHVPQPVRVGIGDEIVSATVASALIGELAGWGLQLDAVTPVIAVGFSLLVGVVGVWPARQAARLEPTAALRCE